MASCVYGYVDVGMWIRMDEDGYGQGLSGMQCSGMNLNGMVTISGPTSIQDPSLAI